MVGVGGVDAADQGVDQPVVYLVAEAGAHEGADRVVGVGAGSSGSRAARSLPFQLSSDVVTNGRTEAGTPSTMPPGIGCSRSCHTIAVAGVGVARSPAVEPDRAGERRRRAAHA